MKELKDRVAVVTGAASGIGAALARALAGEGMRLALADVEEPALAAFAETLRGAGAQVVAIPTDVSQRRDVEALADRVFLEFGGAHLVCNNAGVCQGGPLLEMNDADWEWLLNVNFHGVRLGCSVFGPRLVEQGEPAHILNTASVGGWISGGTLGMYSTTKYAVVGYSEALAMELEPHGVGVSVLCPSFIRTALTDAARNRPAALGTAPAGMEFVEAGMAQGGVPEDVARHAIRGIREGAPYIFTDAVFEPLIEERFQRARAALKRAAEPVLDA
jgi:NAD(P)-dependent dehydrogenase (short-subunit alcohol dehydrogenase family)